MKRKLFSLVLCGFALLLLMGAGVSEADSTALLIGEEATAMEQPVADVYASETLPSGAVHAAEGVSPQEIAEQIDPSLCIDGEYASVEICKTQQDGITYVALARMAVALNPEAQVSWKAESRLVTITTANLTITAQVGNPYIEANGRYLYVPEKVQMNNGKVMLPLSVVTKAFDARLSWDAASGTVLVNRKSGAIQSGESYYDQDSLFWLSRLIQAESGSQPLDGKIAVGNVVMNRVSSSIFPNTIYGVLSQKNQFTTWKNGALANRTPNQSSILAAKLVLDGAVLEETNGATFFDSNTNSWAARNKTCIAVIGNHKFYA